MKIRTVALPAALAGALLLGGTSSAAPGPEIMDAKGDVKGGQAGFDIVSVDFAVTRTVTTSTKVVRGKKVVVTTSTPKDFVVTLTTAGAPVVQPGTAFQIGAAESPCGTFFLFSYFSAAAAGVSHNMQFGNCGEPDATGNDGVFLDPVVKTTGNAISYTVPFRSLPKQVKLGSAFSGLTAYTAVADPLVGFGPGDFSPDDAGTEAASFDFARAASWKVG